jgi:hypothetical protein
MARALVKAPTDYRRGDVVIALTPRQAEETMKALSVRYERESPTFVKSPRGRAYARVRDSLRRHHVSGGAS